MYNLYYFVAPILASIALCDVKQQDISKALNEFSLKLLSEECRKASLNGNVVIGPYTIWTALTIVNEGAGGNTAKELEYTLGIPSSGYDRKQFRMFQQSIIQNLNQNLNENTLDLVNDIFVREEATIKPAYQTLVENIYNVKVETLDFKNAPHAVRHINNRISNVTRGHINEIVNEDDVFKANMFVTSAMFFKGLWKKPFEKLSRKHGFYNEDNILISNVTMMFETGAYDYGSVLNGQAVALAIPYKGERLSMIIILPNKVKISSILQSLTQTSFKNLVRNLSTYHDVDIIMPKFKISSSIALKNTLQGMGINDAFTSNANLRGISFDELLVSDIQHKAEIEVDEQGTTAAAATAIQAMVISAPINPIFRVNKPFLFFLFDKQTESILFMGEVNNPAAV